MPVMLKNDPTLPPPVGGEAGKGGRWQVYEAAPHPAALVDAAGHFVRVNAAWRRRVGTGPSWDEPFAEGALRAFLHRHAAATSPGETVGGELPLRRGGRLAVDSALWTPRDATGPLWLLTGVLLKDLPGGPRPAAAVGSATASLAEFLPVAAAVAEDAACVHVRANAALRGLLGLADIDDALPEAAKTPLCHAAEGKTRPVDDAEGSRLEVPRPGEGPLVLRAWSMPLTSAAGVVRGAIAFYAEESRAGAGEAGAEADMTAELARSRRDLRQAMREVQSAVGTKDRFLAMISHELRTPLTPALVTLTKLIRELSNGDRDETATLRDLEVVRHGIELEARLIDDLLDLTRLARGRLKIDVRPVDLHRVAAETVGLARPDVEAAGLSLDVRLDARHTRIRGDADRLRQVLWNLLTNATKFNKAGGHIEVASSNPTPDTLRVDVSDTGVGIDPDEMPSLFLAFEQMEHRGINRFGGLGLALTISKGLLNLQGGRLIVESEGKGRGALFGIEFPLLNEGAAEASAADATPPTPPMPASAKAPQDPASLDILLVDDHAETLRAMRRLLGRLGHRVKPAASVAEAREATEQRRGKPFDLLVSDIGLPDGSGLELPPLLRERWPGDRVPAVALSGFGMSRDMEASREAGFDVHLVKPVSLDQLQEVIARVTAAPASS